MKQLLDLVNPMLGYLIITGISILGLLILFSIIFNNSPKKARLRVISTFISLLASNILLYVLMYRIFERFIDVEKLDPGLLGFSYIVISTLLINFNSFFMIRDSVPRSKSGGNMNDILVDIRKKDISNKIDISSFLIVLTVSMYFFGNGSLNSLLIVTFVATLLVMLTSILLFPLILKSSQKFFN